MILQYILDYTQLWSYNIDYTQLWSWSYNANPMIIIGIIINSHTKKKSLSYVKINEAANPTEVVPMKIRGETIKCSMILNKS